jgi:hypothetical protein
LILLMMEKLTHINGNLSLGSAKCKTPRLQDCKTGLTDFSFLMPLRIDSEYRKANADSSISFILSHFETNFLVIESDSERKYYPDFHGKEFKYEFIKDEYFFFYKTKYINHLIETAKTPYVAVWDTDAISPPTQIIESAQKLRSGQVVMSIPFDGRFLMCDKFLSDFFKRIRDIEILMKLATVLPLMYGYHSTGGAFMADKAKYLKIGGENENFQGWGVEDVERVKRLEILNLPVHYSEGPLFHLWHPQGQNSWYADKTKEIQNRREFVETCKKRGLNKY